MQLRNLFIAVVLAGTVATSSLAEDSITVVSWGGVYEEAQRRGIYEPFTRATGIEVRSVTYSGGVSALETRAGKERWDVVDMIEDQAITACDAGLLSEVNIDLVADAQEDISVIEDFLPGSFRRCSIAQNVYSTVFAYDDRALLGQKPETISKSKNNQALSI